MGRMRDLLDRQSERLQRLDDEAARRVLAVLEDARRELRERLEQALNAGRGVTFSGLMWASSLAQARYGVERLTDRFGASLDEQVRAAQRRALGDLVEVVDLAEPGLSGAASLVEVDILATLTDPAKTALRHSRTLTYGTELWGEVQRAATNCVSQKLTVHQTVDELTSKQGAVFGGRKGRALAETHVRMQLNTGYNQTHLDGIHELNEVVGTKKDPILKRIDEFINVQTHPISYLLDGKTALPDGTWRVPVAEVHAMAAALKKRPGGVVWRQVGGEYVGDNLPAHYGERGRVHVWRASWADD